MYALEILVNVVTNVNDFNVAETNDNLTAELDSARLSENQSDDEETITPVHKSSITSSSEVTPFVGEEKLQKFEKMRQVKNEISKAAIKFNLKPKNGINYLTAMGMVAQEEEQAVKDIVNFFKTTPQLDKTCIGDYMGEDKPFNKAILYYYIEDMDFSGTHFVEALKKLLAGFRLPGEGQKVDRIMEKFGEKYYKDNPTIFASGECVYLLAYATMMLQTSLHNESARNNRMKLEDYVKLTKGINAGKDIDSEFIRTIYETIETDPITLIEDDEARLRQEASMATSFKRKQDLFIKEGLGLARRGAELIKSSKTSSVQFILVNDTDPIRPMFEVIPLS